MDFADLASLADDTFARLLRPEHRAIRLRFPDRVGRVFDGVLLAQKVEVREGIGEGLTVHATCLAARADLPLAALIGLPIELQFVTDTGGLKRFCAVIDAVRQGESDGGLTVLQLTARDVLALMDGRRSQRVFLDMSLPDVVRTVLDGWRRRFPALAKCFDYQLLDLQDERYPKRAFLMQAQQSDSAFLRSVLARDGVNWFVRPGAMGPDGTPAHCLVLFDDARSLPENAAGPVRFHRRDGTERHDTVSVLSPAHRLVGGGVRLHSWDHETGRVDTAQDAGDADPGEAGAEWANALQQSRIVLPHAGDSADDFLRLARIEHERDAGRSSVLMGVGGVRAQCVGEYNRIDGHPSLPAVPEAREYLTLRLEHWSLNNLPKDLEARADALAQASVGRFADAPAAPGFATPDDSAFRGQRYLNRFLAVHRDVPVRPPWNPVDDLPPGHLTTATVVSAGGQPVWTDGLMRVKLRFHGLEPAEHEHAAGAGTRGDAGDSAWVRVQRGCQTQDLGAESPDARVGRGVLRQLRRVAAAGRSEMQTLFRNGTLAAEWHDVIGVDPARWDLDPSTPQKALTEAELKAITKDTFFPMHAIGYNWLVSNGVNAIDVATRIKGIIRSYRNEAKKDCPGVIVVTHSMGGLLGRALVHPKMGGLKDEVLGIVHGVQPAAGAAAAYRRMRAGFEDAGLRQDAKNSIAAKIGGNYGDEVTAVLGSSPGALQLLPSKAYGNGWLRVNADGKELMSLPVKGDPYEEIYKVRGKWYGLIVDETWLNPAGLKLRDQATPTGQAHKCLDSARKFHDELGDVYHDHTYV